MALQILVTREANRMNLKVTPASCHSPDAVTGAGRVGQECESHRAGDSSQFREAEVLGRAPKTGRNPNNMLKDSFGDFD